MISKHTSKNGVRIVLESMPAVRSVTIGIWVLAGSRNENEFNNGISHFLEHMFFKGTDSRSAKEIAEAFDSIGGEINAFTSKEYTCFYAKVLDTHKELALELLADIFFHSRFDEEEMEKEKKVVFEEINIDQETPDELIHDVLSEASYGKHPLGFPILGSKQVVASLHPDDLRSYLSEHYTPENVVVSVAGNVEESFIGKIECCFDQFSSNKRNQRKMIQPVFQSEHLEWKKETEQAHLCIGYRGYSIQDEEIYSMAVVNNVIGGSMSSRLFQEVREEKGLAYTVFSDHSPFLDNGLLTIYAGTSAEQLDLLRETIERTTTGLRKDGLTEKELLNSKEQLKGDLVLGLESTSSRMSRNGRQELLLNRHRSLDDTITAIDSVTFQSTFQVIEKVLDNPHSSAVITP